MIEVALYSIRISIEVPEDPRAVAPLARMVGSDFFRVFLQHHAPHWNVMQIAKRAELLFGRHR